MGDEEIRGKLMAARAAKAAREEALAAEAEAAELERFELSERLERELNGREGRAFAIVDCSDLGEGFVAMRLGEGVLWKAFAASKMSAMDVDAFVTPCVIHPSVEAYRSLTARRGFVADRCASALSTLYGVERADLRKK